MLIPVGLDRSEVRRNPWISYAIVTINVAVFLVLWIAARNSDVPARANQKLQAVVQYLFEHPYLQIPAELEPYFGPNGRRLLENARQDYRERVGPPLEFAERRQQQKLNEMAADAFATVR